jgi:hypothetical protein
MTGALHAASFSFLTEYYAMKAYWGSGCISPRILDLCTKMEVSGQLHERKNGTESIFPLICIDNLS